MGDSKNPKTRKEDMKPLKDYYDIMVSENIVELELKDSSSYIRLKRYRQDEAYAPLLVSRPRAPRKKDAAEEKGESFPAIVSPLAGIFYRAPSPQSDPFVKEGDSVEAGAVLCIIEAMKAMNEIRADKKCAIKSM